MVKYSKADLDRLFHAFADPTRRAILLQLRYGERWVTELAEPFNISLPAITKHLNVLEEAGLIVRARYGRLQRCYLVAESLSNATQWLSEFDDCWEFKLHDLYKKTSSLAINAKESIDRLIQYYQVEENLMSSDIYGKIDGQIASAERDILEAKRALAKLRKQRPSERVKDYELSDLAGRAVRLSSLFGEKDDLIVVHNMGKGCPYCTLWADGFVGVRDHIENRAAFVLVSHDKPDVAKAFSESRGWNFRVLSGSGHEFTGDMGFLSKEGSPWPGVSTFHRKGDTIERVAKAPFGPGDDFCGVWHFFDLLEAGADNWQPKFSYK